MYSAELDSRQEKVLLELALKAIEHGLQHGREMVILADHFPPDLRENRASFVTLRTNHDLRGCIGTLEAYRPLVTDVCANAYAAAFSDPRFEALTHGQLGSLNISISVLNPAEELRFDSEAELLEQLRPGVDGLILQLGRQRGTFLPSVWASLPDKQQFLVQLKIKAGLSGDFWSEDIRAYRYTTHVIGEKD